MEDNENVINEAEEALSEELGELSGEEAEQEETSEEADTEDTDDEEDEDGEEDDDDDEDDAESNARRKRIINDIMDIIESTLITVFVIVLVFTYLLHPVNIKGHSMEPTLYGDDRIFMTTVYFGIDNGDILVIDNNAVYLLDENGDPYKADVPNNPIDECIIKRVIACGGQTIDIDDSDVTNCKIIVDGDVVDEPYIKESAKTLKSGAFASQFPFKVPKGYYFVMGDNRENSSDSRSGFVGLIKKDQVYGKAIMRYSPLKEFKFLFNSDKKSSDERD
ncbi:MAG: signal peptidase I [Ruminococcus sp.]|nr:signal peptidase I [Ruminococcus sp.]